jgi:hypothetical protein
LIQACSIPIGNPHFLCISLALRRKQVEKTQVEKTLDKHIGWYRIVIGLVTKESWRRISSSGRGVQKVLLDRVFRMVMGRFKHIYPSLMIGISLFIPLFFTYSLCVDLSEFVLLSSDMSFEDPEDEDLSKYQNQIKIFLPKVSYNLLLIGTHFGARSFPFSSPLTMPTQNKPVLRC